MTPGKYNIPDQYKGDSFERIDFEYWITDTTPGNEMDLSGVEPKMQIRKCSADGRLVKTLIIGDGLEWTAQEEGTFYLEPFLITFPSGDYVYDIQFTYPSSSVVTYLYGNLKIINDVTS